MISINREIILLRFFCIKSISNSKIMWGIKFEKFLVAEIFVTIPFQGKEKGDFRISFTQNPGAIQCDDLSEKSNLFYDEELEAEKGFDSDGCSRKLKKRKKIYRKHNRNRSLQRVTIPDPDDGELSDS